MWAIVWSIAAAATFRRWYRKEEILLPIFFKVMHAYVSDSPNNLGPTKA
jgi:hypothetical protein